MIHKHNKKNASIKLVTICASTLLLYAFTARALTVNVAAGASTATIQNAINEVSAAGGGTVNLAAGGYTITATLVPASNVTLNGAGNPATTISCNTSFVTDTAGGLNNLTFQNMKVVSNGQAGITGINITSTGSNFKNIKISNVQIDDFNGVGILLRDVTGMNVSNNNLQRNGFAVLAHNMYLRDSTSVTCANNNSVNGGGCGLHLAGTCSGVSITGNTFTGNGAPGINVQDSPVNITIESNNCSNNNNDGLAFTGTGALINANTCDNNAGYGVDIFSGSGTVSNNTATGDGNGGYYIKGTWTQINNH